VAGVGDERKEREGDEEGKGGREGGGRQLKGRRRLQAGPCPHLASQAPMQGHASTLSLPPSRPPALPPYLEHDRDGGLAAAEESYSGI
jgi:hypothetical protein